MPNLPLKSIQEFLDEKYEKYNVPEYIHTDPIQIPHKFEKQEDIEIAAFLTATIAWGQRKSIIKSADALMQLLEYNPYDFITQASVKEISRFNVFVYRTFNGIDCKFYIQSLKSIYTKKIGLCAYFNHTDNDIKDAILNFRHDFFSLPHEKRTQKHFPDIIKGSAAKRMNMFLRWMVRKDQKGVDFGLWNKISSSKLYIPLDVHVGRVARKLGILKRKQNDWKAVEELTHFLRKLDPNDPVKYDYALFGLGVFEKF